MTGTVLDQIVAEVRKEVARRKRKDPDLSDRLTKIVDFEAALRRARTPALIAEIKPKSPSGGELKPGVRPERQAKAYVEGGADAISVLTEPKFFGGDPEHLVAVRQEFESVPLLRKDFLLDPFQVEEAYAYEADAVLLMVSVLGPRLGEMLDAVKEQKLQALVEVHDERELDAALKAGATLVGVNNRNMRTLEVDLGVTERLAERVPDSVFLVSESGVERPEDVKRAVKAGADGILVGTALMKAKDPAALLRSLRL
jgi:indole-3-glycerol phosphate synthase